MNEYHYRECGLDNVILSGLDFVVGDDEDGVTIIPHVNALHRLLARMVAEKETSLTQKELRFLRTHLGMTQAELANLIGRDAQTIGRYERGETPIEKAIEIVVRQHVRDFVRRQQADDSNHYATDDGWDELSIEEIAGRVRPSANDQPFRVDARDPPHYRPLVAA